MQARPITDDLSIGPQLAMADIAEAKAAGFHSIVVNRPDGEGGPDQPDFADIEAAAAKAGIETRYIPVTVGNIADADIEAFAAAMKDMPKPILAFCKSGTRAAMLWALSQADQRPLPEILRLGSDAGCDLSSLSSRITQRSAT